MRKKTIIVVVLFLILFVALIWYRQEVRRYVIENHAEAVEFAIEDVLNSDIDIHKMTELDNKIFFLFAFQNGTIGSGELSRGLNGKYKLEYVGHGTGWIRERVVETNKGTYLMLAGRNMKGIGVIEAWIEDEKYSIEIPEGEYYLVLTPVRETSLEFTSGMIFYDRNGNEIERIKLQNKED